LFVNTLPFGAIPQQDIESKTARIRRAHQSHSQTNYEFLHRLPMRKLGWTERGARWPDPMEISDSSLIDGALMPHRMVLPWRRRDVGPAIQRRQARRRMPGTILLLALT
jgi:hypothetical protein